MPCTVILVVSFGKRVGVHTAAGIYGVKLDIKSPRQVEEKMTGACIPLPCPGICSTTMIYEWASQVGKKERRDNQIKIEIH